MRALTAVTVVAIASSPFGADAKAVDSIRSQEPDFGQAPLGVDNIEIGRPDQGARISRVDAKLVVFQTRISMTLSIELEGRSAEMRDVTVPLRLPAGSRPIGMNVEIDSGPRPGRHPVTTPAVLLSAIEARDFYKETVKRYLDPGLLEQRGDRLALHVFPITATGIQKVELTVLLPRVPRIAIVPGSMIDRVDVDLSADGSETSRHLSWSKAWSAHRFELPKPAPGPAEDPALDRPAVDGTHSLVAGGTAPPGSFPQITVSICGGPRAVRWIDKAMIRRRIKPQMARLTYCYERELYRDKTLAGTVAVKFAIERDGTSHVLETTGTLTDQVVRSCVARVFDQLEFPQHDDDRIIVNYPLTYRRTGY